MISMRPFIIGFFVKKPRLVLTVLALLVISLNLSACMSLAGNHLKIEAAKQLEVTGTYTLLLYGCRYPDDVENVAILDKEGDPYTIAIYAPDFRYKVKTGLPAEEALKQAEQFVKCSVHYQQTRFSKIPDATGNIVGYEARALYSPIRFGMYDVLDVQYVVRDNRIVVYIKLDPAVDKELRNEGGPDNHNGK
jgi:hypothetical protein